MSRDLLKRAIGPAVETSAFGDAARTFPLISVPSDAHIGRRSGRQYASFNWAGQGLGQVVENRIYAAPIRTLGDMPFDKLGIRVTTGAGDAECQAHMGIYRNDGGLPGVLALDLGVLSIGSATGLHQFSNLARVLSAVLPDPWAWLAVVINRNSGVTGIMPFVRVFVADQLGDHAVQMGVADGDDILGTEAPTGVYAAADETVADWGAYDMPVVFPMTGYITDDTCPIVYW